MKDYLHDALTFISHNRYTALAAALVVAASVWMFGCQVTTASIVEGDRQVTAEQLNREVVTLGLTLATDKSALEANLRAAEEAIVLHNARVESLNEKIELAENDLAVKAERRAQVISLVSGIATSAVEGTLNPAGVITGLVSLAGIGGAIGLGADNRRKNAVIKRLKTDGQPEPTSVAAV